MGGEINPGWPSVTSAVKKSMWCMWCMWWGRLQQYFLYPSLSNNHPARPVGGRIFGGLARFLARHKARDRKNWGPELGNLIIIFFYWCILVCVNNTFQYLSWQFATPNVIPHLSFPSFHPYEVVTLHSVQCVTTLNENNFF